MDNRTAALSEQIQGYLDDITSPRTSNTIKIEALKALEWHLALSCTNGTKDFLALQFTFECNVPSRLLTSIATSTLRLETLLTKEDTSECQPLATQLSLSLSLMQGLILNHPSSKAYVARKWALEILLDLFLASRRLPSSCPTLASTIIDTLLCVLVDNTPGLRAFEEANGLQAVVKILKRAGTPREVRMKCLEFLYFYLLEESPTATSTTSTTSGPSTPAVNVTSTAPSTPSSPTKIKQKPSLVGTPRKPMSIYGSSTYSFSSNVSKISVNSSTPSSRSTSSSSSKSSSSSTSSTKESGTDTELTTPPSSPAKSNYVTHTPRPPSSRSSPTKKSGSSVGSGSKYSTLNEAGKPKSLLMLKKEVEFTPSTPPPNAQKTQSKLGIGMGTPSSRVTTPTSIFGSSQRTCKEQAERAKGKGEQKVTIRSIDEKKEILGTMLGNVDALVEGVRKAGIWGLKG